MNGYDLPGYTDPTWSAHSNLRSLVVAGLVTIAPFVAAVALTYPKLATAFLVGVAAAATLATAPTLDRRPAREFRRSTDGDLLKAGSRR